ncbi:SdiA-regulated domain-containing protein [Christiangramia sp. SM2212]|uniref:SdiA-regulated domain-containing protein n=1 Tax=Christiangramia sediminicola TaxID=3073267 RepID=A0ABU1EPA4_9FLAO|nr:SdiA-regulated domain-containing protein [Christiangramia sp. SM2212]MDR5590196.1 SdiA-regulated domain-containing protein [Christiangramia sp. SM2212]
MNKWVIGIVVFVLLLSGIVYAIYEMNDYDYDDSTKSYEIVKRWKLPEELKEISGLYWVGDEKVACVQDEDGIIYVYDLAKSKVTSKYKFADDGDYEALCYKDGEYWVAESNGKLFNIKSLDSAQLNTDTYDLEFEYRNNIEGLAVSQNGELWLSVKERNLNNEGGYKGVYAFDPVTKKLQREPILRIEYSDPKFDVLRTQNPRKLIRPSDLSFSPDNSELYVLDAEFQKVLIVQLDGKIKELHLLDPEEFEQPEGICFSPSGRMFISNESISGPANILEVKFN